MSDSKNSKRVAIDRLADVLVEDILTATDAEILAEAKEDGIDPAATTARLKDVYKKALTEMRKSRLAAARAAVDNDHRGGWSETVTRLDSVAARKRVEAVLKQNPETHKKLTLAARNGEGLSDSDVQSMLEDLEELGILLPEDNEGNGK